MPSANWGGARSGAGRPRTTLHLTMPPAVLRQYEEIAEAERTTVEEVVKTALLDWLSEWQDRHDAKPAL